jgi:anaerobic dimethyl sulfoxide reductase subunit B (iron-sulfur subunit)
MKQLILFDPEKCSACGACAVACMDQNDTDFDRGERAYRHIYERESGRGSCAYLSVSCRHCADAPCLRACPVGRIRQDPSTGMIVSAEKACIGCRACGQACPFGAVQFDADGLMRKCDGCYIRLANGLRPACASACAFGALRVLTADAYAVLLTEKSETSGAMALPSRRTVRCAL